MFLPSSKLEIKCEAPLRSSIVSYKGMVPNLFLEGKGVIAEGKLQDKKYFIAEKILAKHDENYMPPEVSDALNQSD